jgi:hypothetical protein
MQLDDVDVQPVVNRLRSFGQQQAAQALQQRVLERANQQDHHRFRSKLTIAAALTCGTIAGGVGLASAGALPTRAQDAAHTALGVIGLDVPPGHNRYNGPECAGATTHGEYVDAHPGDPGAAKSLCGKPMRAITHPHHQGGADPLPIDKDHGRPPWAGHGKGNDVRKPDTDDPDEESSATDVRPSVATDLEPTASTIDTEPPTTPVSQDASTTLATGTSQGSAP